MRVNVQRRPRIVGALMAAALAASLLAGCSAVSPLADDDTAWVEPGWMAQLRQDKEEHQNQWLSCLEEHGLQGTALAAGDVVVQHQVPTPAGLDELTSAAMMDCSERLGGLSWFTLDIDEAAYERMLESRACLMALGHPVPEPPTLEVWVQDHGLWNPHGKVYDNRLAETGESWTHTSWVQLNADCPQPGPATFDVSGLS